MGSTSIPATPPPPDYGKATTDGIYTDIGTLPTRRAIDQGARLGSVVSYVDPRTGESKTADFSGLGDMALAEQAGQLATRQNADIQRQQLQLRQELGVANAEQTAKELQAADPAAYATRQRLTGMLNDDLGKGPISVAPSENINAAETRIAELANGTPGNDGRLGALFKAGTGVDPTVSDMGQLGVLGGLQGTVAGDRGAAPALQRLQMQAGRDPGSAPTLQQLQMQAARDPGAAPVLRQLGSMAAGSSSPGQLGSIYDEATRLYNPNITDPSTEALNTGLQKAMADYQLGGKLDDGARRDLLNEVRSGQVDRGNFLGDAAQVVEATELGKASEARQAQRLQNLLQVQQQAFGQNANLRDQKLATTNARLGTLSSLTNDQAALEQSLRGEVGGYATTAENEAAARRGEQAGFATGAQGQAAARRGEQAGYAVAGADQATAKQNQLAALAAQIFGTGNTVQNQNYQNQLQQLGTLAGLAGQDFGQEQQAYGTKLNAAGAALGAAQTKANEERASRAESFGQNQQRLANASAMVLGQPITNQFGSLQGAQNGAVGFTPVGYTPGATTNPGAAGAGANFAQGNYGNLSNMWQTQAGINSQNNQQMMQGLGTAAGMAAMMFL